MSASSTWLAIAGLGAFHGLNPAMGWLFAVALGLHRKSRRALFLALPPIALGHALSVALMATAVFTLGAFVDPRVIGLAGGCVLIAWALYHVRYGHRHRVRVGMMAGFAGLMLWSFLMATAHGAGLMLMPALLPLCRTVAAQPSGVLLSSFAVVATHTLATLAVTAAVALIVYEWLGVGVLRRGWINFDRIWLCALVLTGSWLIAAA